MEQKEGISQRSDFEESVELFSHHDVHGDVDAYKRAMIPSLIIRSVIIALLIGLFGYSIFMIASNALESEKNTALYDGIRVENLESAVKPSSTLLEPTSLFTLQDTLGSSEEYKDYVGGIDSIDDQARRSNYYRNYVSFASKYPDAYGWIYVDYTKVDYPILKGDFNDYYLYRDFNGQVNYGGSITAESGMNDDFDANVNNVIYGHCMKNGSMFRTIKTFMESANRDTLAKSMDIEIYTEDGLYIYKVMSGYRDDTHFFSQYGFGSTESYMKYLNKAASLNTLNVSTPYDENSRICTLITCANVTGNRDERYVIHGVLTTFIPGSQL